MKFVAIIPARYASTRFPGKPLVDIGGQSMISRVYAQCQSSQIDDAIVATDDARIFDHCKENNIKAAMTARSHQSGTDRCAELAIEMDADVIFNVQGDEPFLDPSQLNELKSLMIMGHDIGTMVKEITNHEDLINPNRVKAVMAGNKALYFSRQTVPFVRDEDEENWIGKTKFYKHLGLYAYRREVLLEIAQLPPSELEKAEALEQLRWLEAGYSIHAVETAIETPNIDTPEDLEKVLKLL